MRANRERKLKSRLAAGLLIWAAVSLLAGSASGTTINVPADQPTIQAGIDAAQESDTVLVAPGTYTGAGNRDIGLLKAVVIRSSHGADQTIIDCEGQGRGFSLSGNGSRPTIEGLTITNGNGGNQGGAIESFTMAFVLRNCLILNNTANYGGAIYTNTAQSGVYIINCTVIGNTALEDQGSVYYENGSIPATFANCIMYSNTVNGSASPVGGMGGTLSCCDLFGNLPGDWIEEIAEQAGANGNFSTDPDFLSSHTGDYHLRSSSPCAAVNNSCGVLIGALGATCLPESPDGDGDGVCDAGDNCPSVSNADQLDSDQDGIGDTCDDCAGFNDLVDTDSDGLADGCDNCPESPNIDQTDTDGDGSGDVCDLCQGFDDQLDSDSDGMPDACDVCSGFDDLADADIDGVPNGCDICTDTDSDGFGDPGYSANQCQVDNCPDIANPDQQDEDGDGVGDVCQFCCVGTVGNCNGDPLDVVTIGDVAVLVNHLFIEKPPLSCAAECDVNQSGGVNPSQEMPGSDITIGDVAELTVYLFGHCDPYACPINDCLFQ